MNRNTLAIYIMVLFVIGLSAVFLGAYQYNTRPVFAPDEWIGEFALLVPGRDPKPITTVSDTHGRVVGWGGGCLIIIDPSKEEDNAEARFGLEAWKGTAVLGVSGDNGQTMLFVPEQQIDPDDSIHVKQGRRGGF